MGFELDQDQRLDAPEKSQPRFGSYIGLIYVTAILCILSFAIFYDVRPGHAFDQLKPGMSPTEVAAILGVPRSEAKSGSRIVQTWQIPDGFILEVEYQNGKLTAKQRRAQGNQAP